MMDADYKSGWQRAQMAAQGVGFEPTPYLDGDAQLRFVRQTMELVLHRFDEEAISEEFYCGVGEGATWAWNRRMETTNHD